MVISMEQENQFQKIENSIATHYPFWKKPINVCNRVETRVQIKLKPKATKKFVKRYMHYLNVFSKEYFSSDDNLTSDSKSISDDDQ